jgi:hypothetical protein
MVYWEYAIRWSTLYIFLKFSARLINLPQLCDHVLLLIIIYYIYTYILIIPIQFFTLKHLLALITIAEYLFQHNKVSVIASSFPIFNHIWDTRWQILNTFLSYIPVFTLKHYSLNTKISLCTNVSCSGIFKGVLCLFSCTQWVHVRVLEILVCEYKLQVWT